MNENEFSIALGADDGAGIGNVLSKTTRPDYPAETPTFSQKKKWKGPHGRYTHAGVRYNPAALSRLRSRGAGIRGYTVVNRVNRVELLNVYAI